MNILSSGIKILVFFNIVFIHASALGQGFDKSDSLARSIPDSITQSQESFANYLKYHFKTDEKIVRALYVWLASNITYDLDMLDSLNKYDSLYTNEDLIISTLKNKKGICQNYAEVFTRICDKCGIPSYIVTGYTRQFEELDTKIGHVWNVAMIDSIWYLFDPTWGAGFTRFERFHKKFTVEFYKTNPDSFIKSHMPFDPIWQLKDFSITHSDFLLNTSSANDHINFRDSISKYSLLTEYQKAKSSLARSEANGLNQPELIRFYNHKKDYATYCLNSYNVDQYNHAVDEFNRANAAYKKYMKNLNKGAKNYVKLDDIIGMLNSCRNYLNSITVGVITQAQIDLMKSDIIKFKKSINTLKIKLKQK